MTKFIPKLPLVVLASLISVLPKAHAINSINVQTFNPSTSDHFVILEDGYKSEWPKSAQYYFGANYNYVTAPLVVLDPTQTTKSYNIIDNIQTVDLFFGFKASNNLGLFIALPIDEVAFSSTPTAGFPNGSYTAIGDVKIEAKIRITDDASPTSIALIPEIHLPTGATQYFVSDASTYVGLRATIERQFNTFTLVGNVGFAAASNAIYQDSNTFQSGIDYRKRLILGIGGFLPFNDTWGMNAEFSNISMLPFDKALNPNEAYVGIRYAANDSFVYTAGASLDELGGPGGLNYRLIAGIRYTVFDDKKMAPRPIAMNPNQNPTQMPARPVMNSGGAIIATAPHAVMRLKRIEISTPINFENNSYQLMPDSKQTLDDVASLLKKNQNSYKMILVDGHTSGAGNDAYNLKLSLARARSVKSYLISQGIPASALEARGFGNRSPKVSPKAKNADAINRRVEFLILK